MEEQPLKGVRVVDFTWAWAGPYATLLLAFMGAEVIKVESLKRLDHTRVRSLMGGPVTGGPDYSTVFNDMNLNKLSLRLDLTRPKAIEIVKRLVKISDVVTQNMRPGVMEKLGLSYEVLKGVNPKIIMLSSSAVGATGPERTYAGYAPTFCATGGLAYISGYPEGTPITLSGAIDTRVGTTAAFAVLAALNYRQRSGQGQFIDLSSAEAVSCLMGEVFLGHAMNQRVTERRGNRDDSMAPHNCYPCRGQDRWVTIAISTEEEWEAFRQVLGNPAWSGEERFNSARSRYQHQEQLDRLISEWTVQHTDYEVTDSLQKVGIAAAPTLNGDMVRDDPHLKERDILTEVNHQKIGKRLVVTPPWRFSTNHAQVSRSAPLIGEHNGYVLGELLGMSQDEIEQLTGEQVVY